MRKPSPEIIERTRQLANEQAGDHDELCFYTAAVQLGCSPEQAQYVEETLTVRVMRARGAL